MSNRNKSRNWPKLNLIAFIVMVGVNALANILPFNGMTTGAVSDSYPNLFAPAGFTFAIWGVIYVMLGAFVFYGFRGFDHGSLRLVYKRISMAFIFSSLVNALWIACWHYRLIPLSMLLMILILLSLIYITHLLKGLRLSLDETRYVRIPFGIYFGWITVATIANMTSMFVSLGWHGSPFSEEIWMILMLLIGLAIGIATALRVSWGTIDCHHFLGLVNHS
jgi:hypothetical protein